MRKIGISLSLSSLLTSLSIFPFLPSDHVPKESLIKPSLMRTHSGGRQLDKSREAFHCKDEGLVDELHGGDHSPQTYY